MGRLVISRRIKESFILNHDISIQIINVDVIGGDVQVKVLIDAPDNVEIWREELYEKIYKNSGGVELNDISRRRR